MNKIAQIDLYDKNTTSGSLQGFGSLGLETNPASEAPNLFVAFISSAIGLITLIAVIWFIFTFISGALGIISSGGDKNSMEAAKKRITSGLIGLTITVLGVIIIRFIGSIIGLGDILEFSNLFQRLIIK